MIVRVPGDKSISQRALIMATLASGESRIRGLLPEGDPASTANALRRLGSHIPDLGKAGPEVTVEGLGLRGLRPPQAPLDLENSGTGARLLLGVLAGQHLEAVVTGDASLRKRPMARITDPLATMGARFEALEAAGRLPIKVRGGDLVPLSYRMPVASAQLKSALLLAGLVGGVEVDMVEPGRSRDHTERAFSGLGVPVVCGPADDGWSVQLTEPPTHLPPVDMEVPGDFSSAAFFVLFGLLGGAGEDLMIKGVGLNPTRIGLLPVLRRMGAEIEVEGTGATGEGEPMGDLLVRRSGLEAFSLVEKEVPGLIDEIPILAVGAARAQGVTRITGAKELRVKETDRISAMVKNLRALGIQVDELEDGMEIVGSDQPLRGRVETFGDHRIAMAFGVLGSLQGNEITVDRPEVASVSFPGFWGLLERAAEGQGGPKAQ